MKLTKDYLKQCILQELKSLEEADPVASKGPVPQAPGTPRPTRYDKGATKQSPAYNLQPAQLAPVAQRSLKILDIALNAAIKNISVNDPHKGLMMKAEPQDGSPPQYLLLSKDASGFSLFAIDYKASTKPLTATETLAEMEQFLD